MGPRAISDSAWRLSNFMMDEGQKQVQATYRDNYGRLAKVKRVYDPDNLFRVNQNIVPASA